MREIRTSGSEGGEGGITVFPYPYHDLLRETRHCKQVPGLESPPASRGWRACARHDGAHRDGPA